MPDINLLKDTERLEEAPKKPPSPGGRYELSAPESGPKKGLTGVFRSLFGRSTSPPPPPGPATMGLERTRPGERILTEKRRAAPTVIPLPDDESFNVNLLTEELTGGFSQRQKFIQLGLVAAAAALFVGLVYLGLTLYERNVSIQIAATKQELDQVNLQISLLSGQQAKITATTKKIAAIQSLVDQHIRWTKFFERLEHYLLPSVTLGTIFTGDIQGSLNFSAKTDSYEHVAAQYLILEQAVVNRDFIRSFRITGASRSVNNNIPTVNFTIGLELEASLLENVPAPLAATGPETVPPST